MSGTTIYLFWKVNFPATTFGTSSACTFPVSVLHRITGISFLNNYSGNALERSFLAEPCYNLVYMELAGWRLTRLPDDLAQLVPNLRSLNLNYNFLEDVRPLEGLRRLTKLTVIGSRLKSTKALIRILRGMPEVQMLDLR